uniref:Uncharacterized protein n=1 Tax=Oryza punctata TaxID=4537 RepID=A0A0E0JJM1_ORYPU
MGRRRLISAYAAPSTRFLEGKWRGPLGEDVGATTRLGLVPIDGDGVDVLAVSLRACSRAAAARSAFPCAHCIQLDELRGDGTGMERRLRNAIREEVNVAHRRLATLSFRWPETRTKARRASRALPLSRIGTGVEWMAESTQLGGGVDKLGVGHVPATCRVRPVPLSLALYLSLPASLSGGNDAQRWERV